MTTPVLVGDATNLSSRLSHPKDDYGDYGVECAPKLGTLGALESFCDMTTILLTKGIAAHDLG